MADFSPYKLLVRSPNWLGDCVLAMPAMRELRRFRPNAHISVLAKKSVADVWRMCPYVDEVIPFEIRKGIMGLDDRWDLGQELKKMNFDLCLIIPNSFDAALVPYLARIRRRMGWATYMRGMLLNRKVPFPHHLDGEQQPHCQLYLVEKLVHHAVDHTLDADIKIPEEAKEYAAKLRENFFVVCPGANYGTAKCWLPENYVETIKKLHKETGLNCYLVGGKGDSPVCFEIAKEVQGEESEESFCQDLSGKTNLFELAAVLEKAKILITNDTGTMHLGAVVKTPVVAIFGPTNWLRTAPLGSNNVLLRGEHDCRKRCRRTCESDHRCMKAVTVDMVMKAAQEKLQATK